MFLYPLLCMCVVHVCLPVCVDLPFDPSPCWAIFLVHMFCGAWSMDETWNMNLCCGFQLFLVQAFADWILGLVHQLRLEELCSDLADLILLILCMMIDGVMLSRVSNKSNQTEHMPHNMHCRGLPSLIPLKVALDRFTNTLHALQPSSLDVAPFCQINGSHPTRQFSTVNNFFSQSPVLIISHQLPCIVHKSAQRKT